MPKIIKFESFDEDIPIILAIGAPMKDYQFAIKLKQKLDEHEIQQEAPLKYYSKKHKIDIEVPYFSMRYDEYQSIIISNKINNKSIIGKYDQADFFIISDDPHWDDEKSLISEIKMVSGVTFVIPVKVEHNEELLLLREMIEMQQLEEKKKNKLILKRK